MRTFNKLLTLLTLVVLGACSSTSDTLFGEDGKAKAPKTSSASFDGNFVKNKIANFKSEQAQLKSLVDGRKETLQTMRNDTNTAVSDYRSAVAQINSKLQLGTTPGNPELMDEWKEARAKLEKINNVAFDIKRLVADVESDLSMVDYMVGSINSAYKIRGATEEDHKSLRALEEEAKQIGSNISIFARQLDGEAERQQAYVDAEKHNLNDVALNIKNGKLYGASGSTDFFADGGSMFSSDDSYEAFISESEADYGVMPQRKTTRPASRGNRVIDGLKTRNVQREPLMEVSRVSKPTSTRPITVIVFDKANIDFEEALYQSLNRALERNPSATFEISGVSAQGKSSASVKKNVRKVMNSMTDMGLPASRIAITMQTDSVDTDEVRVFEK